MSNYSGAFNFPAQVYQFEESDVVKGGPDGIDNVPLTQLSDRTFYLKALADFTFLNLFNLNPLGSFKEGFQINSAGYAVFDEASGKWLKWTGSLPKVVAKSSKPETTGGIYDPVTNPTGKWKILSTSKELHYAGQNILEQWRRSLAEAGLTLVDGSFEEGASVQNDKQAVWYIAGGQCYVWGGDSSTLPKVVPAGSTPHSTGEVKLGAWVSVGDASLRNQISDADGATKYPELQIARWRDEGDVRGWGAGEEGFNAAMSAISSSGGGTLFVNEDILFTSLPINHLPKVTVHWNAKAIVQTGLTSTYAYIMDGGADTPSYDNTDHFTLANKTNCYGLRLEAQDYTVGINAIGVCVRHCYGWTYEGGAIIGFNNGGFYETNNYEGKASKFTMVVANTRLDNSVGFESNSTDSWFSEISPVGYSIGEKFNKSANVVEKFHSWGNTVDNLVGVMGKMNIGIVITENAGFSTYRDIIADTPVRKNTGSAPSRTNGGVGVICDAWDCVLDGVLVLPSRNDSVAKSTLPMITTTQRSTIKDFQVSSEQYATDIWISFENNSGIARNHVSGYGYAEKMRTGMTFGPNSGAVLASADGVTMSSQSLTSGIWNNTLSFSIATTVTAIPSATGDVIVNIAPVYGVKSGFGGTVKGGMYAFYYATANSAKQLYDVSLEVVSDNTAKFLLTFIDGTTRYAHWTDVSNGSARQISLSGIIDIK